VESVVSASVAGLTVGPFQENCYLLTEAGGTHCVIIDPGDEAERIIAAVDRTGAVPDAIWLTHAHLDHIGAISALRRQWDIPVYLHPLDEKLYAMASRQAALYGLPFEQPEPADRTLGNGDVLEVGALRFTVMHTPGHAPGHVVFHGHSIALVGDCLFAGSIGRTDLPMSNPRDLAASLERIVALAEDTIVYPGHGPVTSIGVEVATNPFLNGVARIVGA
jgi:glyoxylase-like metal-dependent hydrolase (beta-lactamase superfamily II)